MVKGCKKVMHPYPKVRSSVFYTNTLIPPPGGFQAIIG